MTGPDCHTARLELTELLLLGRPLPARLSWHVSTCADCAREVEEISAVTRTLRRAEPVSFGGTESAPPPDAGSRRELGVRIAREVRSARVARWRRRIVVAAAAVVLVGCGALIPVLSQAFSATQPGPSAVRTVGLARTGVMIPHPWGTEVPVALSGLQPGQLYRLMTENGAGQQAPAGSVRVASAEPVRTNMVTAMSRDSIVTLLVENQQGQQVAAVAVSPPVGATVPTPTR